MESLQTHLAKIRLLRTQGSNFEFAAMEATHLLERLPILWKTSRTDTFDDFLKRERLCTAHRYQGFKNAIDLFGNVKVKAMGVQAACLLARQPSASAQQHLTSVLTFSRNFGTGPTYQYVTTLVGRRRKPGPSRGDLLRYIEALEAEVVRCGGHLPKAA